MFSSFRHSMTWLHTWFGLVLGYVLVVVFFFGSLSVFDREIDRWAIPSSRFEAQPMPSFDRLLEPAFRSILPDEAEYEAADALVTQPLPPREQLEPEEWWAYTTHRDPVLGIGAGFGLPHPKDPEAHNHVHGSMTIDPRSGKVIPSDQLALGSGFFYPLHYSLHIEWLGLGYWIVGLAALVMLAALVSGVVMHRKVFRELFRFRPQKRTQRSALDLHNLTGIVALPFHFMFALSGLVIFSGIYLPVADTMLKPLHDAHEKEEEAQTGLPHDAAGVPAKLVSVDAMVAEAQRRWAARDMAGDVGFLVVNHVDDANLTVSVYRAGTDRIASVGEGVHFKGTTGEVLHEDPPQTQVSSVNEFVTGLHLQHFKHWLLRWFYFVGGLAGCACIATGFIFFVEKRKRQHAASGAGGSRWVDALAVATVTGMVVATLAMLVANRLLSEDLAGRDGWEKTAFWGTWLLAFFHAALRTTPMREARRSPAWSEQCALIAVLAVCAVLLNWISTGDHLLRTIGAGYWPVAGIDLTLLVGAVMAALTARRLWSSTPRQIAIDARGAAYE